MDSATFEQEVRDLPCDAKLVFVVLEKRGPFTQEELTQETYLSEEEAVYAVAVLEEREMVEKHEHAGEEIYEISRPT